MVQSLNNQRVVSSWLVGASTLLIWGTAFGGRSFGPIRALLVALPYGDKVGHFALYGTIALALGLLAQKRTHLVGAGLAVILIGVADEFRQLTESNRNFSAGDVLANLAGVCLGLIAALAVHRFRDQS
jgi:VanZ family protein